MFLRKRRRKFAGVAYERETASRQRVSQPFLEIPVDEDLTLRLVTLNDADRVHALITANLKFLSPWVGWADESFTREANKEFIRRNLDAYDAGTAYALGIYEEGFLRGVVDIRGIDDSSTGVEVGYWLAEDAQGKGLATRSVQTLIDYVRRHHNISYVVLHTMVGNEASVKVAERLGFEFVGEADGKVPEKRYMLTIPRD